MKAYTIALDQGTTSSRAIVFDAEGNVVSQAQFPLPQIYPKPGWVEHDPAVILETQLRALSEAFARSGLQAADIAGIGITNQRETTVVWEKRTGRPICNAIVWQCRRTAAICDALSADGLGAAAQVFCEFLAFFLLLLCALAAAGLLAFLLLGRFGVVIPELQRTEGFALSLLPALLPPALMLGAFQFLLYELSGSAVSGILLQFLSAVLQGYLSGCFYPSSFFPEGLRRLGALLPAGVGMEYLRAALLALPENPARVLVWSYFLLFLLLSLLLRRRRNRS